MITKLSQCRVENTNTEFIYLSSANRLKVNGISLIQQQHRNKMFLHDAKNTQ